MDSTRRVSQTPEPERDYFAQVPERVWRSWPIRQQVVCFILQRGHPNAADHADEQRKRVRGTWFGHQKHIADELGTTVGTVKKALRAERQAGNVISRGTHVGNGYDGFNAYAIVGATDLAPAEAIDLLAKRWKLNLLPAAEETPGRQAGTKSVPPIAQAGTKSDPPAGTESVPAAGTKSVPAIETDHEQEDHEPSDHEHVQRSAQVASDQRSGARSQQGSWIEVVREALAFVRVEIGLGALTGYARVLKLYENEHGPEAAANRLDEVVTAVESHDGRRKPERVVHLAFAGDDGHLDDDHPFSKAIRAELPDLSTVVRWNANGNGCTWPGDPEAEIEPWTADELWEMHGGEPVELDYDATDDGEDYEPDLIEHDDGNTWSITNNPSAEERAERHAEMLREYGMASASDLATPDAVEPGTQQHSTESDRSEIGGDGTTTIHTTHQQEAQAR